MAAQPTFGSLAEYQAETESFSTYVERVKIFFMANDVAEDKQLPVFLSVLGAKNFTLLCNLLLPDKPQTKTLILVSEVLKKHFEPKPLVTAERFHFHRQNQLSTESLADYVAELRRISAHCDFGDHLNNALHDRLLCGLRSENMQRRLLSMKDLTLQDALDTAQAMEAADKNAKTLQGSESASVIQLSKSQSWGGNSRKQTATQRSSASQKSPRCSPVIIVGKPTIHHTLAVPWIPTATTVARRATSVRCADQISKVCLRTVSQAQCLKGLTTLRLLAPLLKRNCAYLSLAHLQPNRAPSSAQWLLKA